MGFQGSVIYTRTTNSCLMSIRWRAGDHGPSAHRAVPSRNILSSSLDQLQAVGSKATGWQATGGWILSSRQVLLA